MKLHQNPQLYADAIKVSADILSIPQEFVEKDYWICQILQRLSRHDKSKLVVWKGGTSLTKAYGIINRFSSDVDIAILTESLSQNQQKKLVTRIAHDSTIDLTETDMGMSTIKNNRFRKTFHTYPSYAMSSNSGVSFLGRFVIFEINTYGNPYPYEKRRAKTFITEIMESQGLFEYIDEYDMGSFEINVLDKRMTMCEKIVSLLRFSFDDGDDSKDGLVSKIRHFYDLFYLLNDDDCKAYLSGNFKADLIALISHDKSEFDRPRRWKTDNILTSKLFLDFDGSWNAIKAVYEQELGRLSFRQIPNEREVAKSVRNLMEYVNDIIRTQG